MDRDRLKDIHQSDLTESRVNEDFVIWLKTKGPFWLILCLAFIFAFLYWTRFQEGQRQHVRDAWVNLESTYVPDSLLEVAQAYPDVGAVSDLARLRAAQRYLASVNAMLDINHTFASPQPLTEEKRAVYLADAKALFRSIIDEPEAGYDRRLIVINALAGLAAIAENENEPERAQSLLTEAAEMAQGDYPILAERLVARADTELPQPVTLAPPSEPDTSQPIDQDMTPVQVDQTLLDLMSGSENDQ